MTKQIYEAYETRACSILYKYILRSSAKNNFWILPANICPIVPITLFKAKKKIIFCDISLSSFCLDEEKALTILQKNANKIEGIIFVRTYGCPNEPLNFFKRAKEEKESIFLVDDKCLCPPSFTFKESQADLTLYSTGYSKYVDLGWGGWGFGKNPPKQVNKKIKYFEKDFHTTEKAYRNALEVEQKYLYSENNWLDTRMPKIKYEDFKVMVLKRLNAMNKRKKDLNSIYSYYLSEFALPDEYHNWRYNITCSNPEEIIYESFKMGYFASRHYKSLVPSFGFGKVRNSEWLAARVVNLFNDLRLSEYSVEKLANAIKKIIKK